MRQPKKTLILQTAAQLFANQGFEGCSVDDIAAKAKIAKGTIYYHFKSKEEILLALLDEGFSDFVNELKQRLATCRGARDRVEELIDYQVTFFSDRRDFCRVFLSELWRLESHWKTSVRQIQKHYLKPIDDTLREGQKEGIFRRDLHREALTISFFSLVAITTLDWVVFHPQIKRRDIVKTLTTVFLQGVAVSGA